MATRSGQERKARGRARRQLHHTYDLERLGVDPAEAKSIAAEQREAPEPRDGAIFTGPDDYVIQDIKRIEKLREFGHFNEEECRLMDRQMLLLVSQAGPVAITAYKALHSRRQKDLKLEIELFKLKLEAAKVIIDDAGEGDSVDAEAVKEVHQHVHFHGGEKQQVVEGDPMVAFLTEMQQISAVGQEYLEDDPEYVEAQKVEAKKRNPAKKAKPKQKTSRRASKKSAKPKKAKANKASKANGAARTKAGRRKSRAGS